jgi:hypothetical protein
MKFAIIGTDALKSLIAKVGKAGAALKLMIQNAAIQCIAQVVQHGNTGPARSLVDATPKHQRAALTAFFEKHAPLRYDSTLKHLVLVADSPLRKLEITEEWANALPSWESCSPAPEPKSIFDVEIEAEKFLNRLSRLAASPEVTLKDKGRLQALVDANARYTAHKILGDAAETAVVSKDKKPRKPRKPRTVVTVADPVVIQAPAVVNG